MSHVTHMNMSHVTHLNGPCCTNATPASLPTALRMSPVTYKLCYECVVSQKWMSHAHTWMSHGAHMNESCDVQVVLWMRRVTHMNESWHKHEWVMAHIWMSPVTYKLCYECVVSHIWMSHGTSMNESWHTYECDGQVTYRWGTSCVMGWLRLVGSIKLQFSYAEYCLFYRALLQNRPIIWSILLTTDTPYECDIQVVLWVYIYTSLRCCDSCCESHERPRLD